MRWALTPLLHALARNPDLLLLGAIAWAVGVAAVGEAVGVGPEVGAFLAGVSLASTPYREAIGSLLVTVRDFLLLFFFIDLGSRLQLGEAVDQLAPRSCSRRSSSPRSRSSSSRCRPAAVPEPLALETGLSMAQISEFSLILAALGLRHGHIDEETTTLMTVVALVTIAGSSHLLPTRTRSGARLAPALDLFERPRPARARTRRLRRHRHRPQTLRRGACPACWTADSRCSASTSTRRVVRRAQAGRPRPCTATPRTPSSLDVPAAAGVGVGRSTIRRTDANLALLRRADPPAAYIGRTAVAAHRRAHVERLLEGRRRPRAPALHLGCEGGRRARHSPTEARAP